MYYWQYTKKAKLKMYKIRNAFCASVYPVSNDCRTIYSRCSAWTGFSRANGCVLPRMTLGRYHGELFPAYYYRSLFAWRQWRSLGLRLVAWSWSLDLMLSRLNVRRLGSSWGYISSWWRTEDIDGWPYNYAIYIHNGLNILNEWTGNALRMVSNIKVLGNQSQV